MSNLGNQFKDIKTGAKNAAKKAQETELFSKVTQSELFDKAKTTVEENAQKIPKKNRKYIKIGVISLVVVIIGVFVFNLFSGSQDDKNALEFAKESLYKQNNCSIVTESKLMGTIETDVKSAGVVKRYIVELSYQDYYEETISLFRIVQKRENGEFIIAGDETYGEINGNRTRDDALEKAIDTATNQGKYKYKKIES